MTEKEKLLDSYLKRIASNIDISDTMRENAEKSYKAVGQWLGDCDESSSVKIMPQGSFYLGTVIKPVSDKDEYDIDLVCLLKNAKYKSEYEIKNIVGNRLKEHKTYRQMLQDEGKRCWTLNYNEFHMDILPCVPNDKYYIEPYFTEIKLTHKLSENCYMPKYSNPYKYHDWFEGRMKVQAIELRKTFAAKNDVEIDKVPIYKIKTPLQQAIQLLKRHRDITYDGLPESRKKNAPISIIITTLAAHSYNNEVMLYDALYNIICNMEKYIKVSNGKYIISNPVMEAENFADKWNENPEKAKEFFWWLKEAKDDIITAPLGAVGLNNVAEKLSLSFGRNVVQRAFKEAGDSIRTERESKSLYVEGLQGGLTTTSTATTKKVGGHTFFGK
ncbi:MAG: nucleotidyltransferase [Acutalibacteraceae bacterium]|nr:nucleotidyltransferase [Acutalibacteraceae bacterium]